VLWWNLRQWRLALVNLFVMVFNLPGVLHLYQMNPPRKQEEAPRQFKVVTYNVRAFNYRWTAVDSQLQFLKQLEPDILCLQEFYTFQDQKGGKNAKRTVATALSLPYISFILTAQNYPYGLAIFSKFPIAGGGRVTDEGRANENGIQYADVRLYGQTLRVYNVHLASFNFHQRDRRKLEAEEFGLTGWNSYQRMIRRMRLGWRIQLRQLAHFQEHLGQRYRHVLIAGDFNNVPYGYVYNQLSRGMTDAWRASGQGAGFTFRQGLLRFRIDHVLTGPNLNPLHMQIVGNSLSDHQAQVATLQLEEF
jgi:endonuclease/exonuclease/phosphatase family metal-dependent hydrolase